MDNLSTVEKVLNLMDLLTTEVDEYVQEHEELQRAYNELLKENDALKDTIANLMDESAKKDGYN